MPTDATIDKATRLYLDGQVTLRHVTYDGDLIATGVVQGDHGFYAVAVDPEEHWCRAASPTAIPHDSYRVCSHVLALRLAAGTYVAARTIGEAEGFYEESVTPTR